MAIDDLPVDLVGVVLVLKRNKVAAASQPVRPVGEATAKLEVSWSTFMLGCPNFVFGFTP